MSSKTLHWIAQCTCHWCLMFSTLIHLLLNTRNYTTFMHLCNNSTVYYDHVGAVGTSNLHPDTLVWCFHTWQGVVVLRCYGEDSTHVEPAKEEISAFVKVKAAQTNKIKLADRNCNYRKYKPCPQWPQRTRKGRIRPRSHASLATRSTRRGLACRSRRSCRQPGQGDINLDLSISHEITFKCFVHSFQLLRYKYI